MTEGPGSRAADLAAQQVESIVAAAQAAADSLRQEAEREVREIRRNAERQAEEVLAAGRAEASKQMDSARERAAALEGDAKKEADRLREEARTAAATRVTAAEQAAEHVMSEARALSGGLRQLGQTLSDQGERILRDVQAAHRRMQADLRVGSEADRPAPRPAARPASPPPEPGAAKRPRAEGPARGNPLADLDVPNWVGRDG